MDDGAAALEEQPAPMAIVEAVHHAARALVDVVLPLFADAIACVVGLALLVRLGGIASWGVVVLAVVALVAARLLSRPSDVAFSRYLGVIEGVADAFDGRAEILASGCGRRYAEQRRADIERWQRASLAADVKGAIASRLPFVALASLALLLFATRGIEASDALVLFAVSSVFVGAARGAVELARLPARIREILPLAHAETPSQRGDAPTSGVIEWADVGIAYGERAVIESISLRIDRGEVVALAGANGAGKTTLLLTALGLKAPTRGRLTLGGVDVRHADLLAWRRSTAYLPQRPYLLPHRDVRSAMQFPSSDVSDADIERACARVHLLERLKTFPGDPLTVPTDALSAGERQRLALARMLTKSCAVYVLDEPDANLDAEGVGWIVELLGELRDTGKVILLAAHTREVLEAADRVVHLAAGRVSSIEPRAPRQLMKVGGAARNESC